MLCLVVLAPSVASAGWSAPITVSGAGTSTSQTEIAGNSDGDAWVVWKRNVAGFDVIQGTKVAIDGSQGPIVTISDPTSNATDPVVTMTSSGSAMVGWINTSTVDDSIETASIAADGTVGAVVSRSVAGPVGQPAKDLSISMGDDGTSGASWIKFNGTNWIVQAVRIAADGTSGTIHDLSDSSISSGAPSISAVPPAAAGTPNSYRAFWPQGTGTDSNVASREITSADTVSDLYLAFAADTGGDPFDVQVQPGEGGTLNAMWIRYRKDFDTTTAVPYYNWAAEWLRLPKGSTPISGVSGINAVSPTVSGEPYNLSALAMAAVPGGQPVAAWTHDLDGGGQRVETWRAMPNGSSQPWANPSPVLPALVEPTIAANSSGAAVGGWTVPGALPGQSVASWTRFSNSSFDSFTPTGTFVYSADPGFVVANDGKTLAAFTAIDGGAIGTTRIYTFTDPASSVDPDVMNYGPVAISQPNKRFLTILSNGETSDEVLSVSLSGPNASQFELSGVNQCLRALNPASFCQIPVTFTPGSTGTKTATVTVLTTSGSEATNLTGSGINRTRNSLTATPKNSTVRKGRVVNVKVKAKNVGGTASNSTKICVNWRKRALRLSGNGCRTLGSVPAGSTRNLNFRFKVLGRAPRGSKLPVIFRLRANNAVVRQAVVNIRRKGN